MCEPRAFDSAGPTNISGHEPITLLVAGSTIHQENPQNSGAARRTDDIKG